VRLKRLFSPDRPHRIRSSQSCRTASLAALLGVSAVVIAACRAPAPPPPPPNPPLAVLDVLPTCGAAPLTVNVDGFGSTNGAAPIASYKFDFGDGTSVTRTPANRQAQHTYAAPGPYVVTETVTDTAGLSGTATRGITVMSTASVPALAVSVGYADASNTHNPPASGTFPSPWAGSPGVNFVGTSGNWDAGAIMISNPGPALPCVSVAVDIGPVQKPLWNNLTIPSGTTILTETAPQNFDTSDTSAAGVCGSPSTVQPTVTIWSPAGVATHTDTSQVLNTVGVDSGHCPPPPFTEANNESHPWVPLS
jgi:PKD repeat protein